MHEVTFRRCVDKARPQPLPLRDGQHPRALLLDPHRHARGHREGLGDHQDVRGQGPATRASLLQRGGGQQGRPRHRRRGGRHPGRSRPGRRRPQGHHRREADHHRRGHGQARQDLPHHRLLGLHPHAAHGGLLAAREHHPHDLLRGRQGRGLRGQLHRGHPQESLHGRLDQVHRLRDLRAEVPGQSARQLQRGPRADQGHLHPLPAGGAQAGGHPGGLLPLLPDRASARSASGSARPTPSTTSRRTRSSQKEFGAIVVATGLEVFPWEELLRRVRLRARSRTSSPGCSTSGC